MSDKPTFAERMHRAGQCFSTVELDGCKYLLTADERYEDMTFFTLMLAERAAADEDAPWMVLWRNDYRDRPADLMQMERDFFTVRKFMRRGLIAPVPPPETIPTCVYCEGHGDNQIDYYEEGAWPAVCAACDGTGESVWWTGAGEVREQVATF